jgi:hypothetical protein
MPSNPPAKISAMVGSGEGFSVGIVEGFSVGYSVGFTVRNVAFVGVLEGIEGEDVGARGIDGSNVGTDVGLAIGPSLGCEEASPNAGALGDCDGGTLVDGSSVDAGTMIGEGESGS